MAKKAKKKAIVKKEGGKQEEVINTVLVDEVKPFNGLLIGKKEKYYQHPAVVVENRWQDKKRKDQVK